MICQCRSWHAIHHWSLSTPTWISSLTLSRIFVAYEKGDQGGRPCIFRNCVQIWIHTGAYDTNNRNIYYIELTTKHTKPSIISILSASLFTLSAKRCEYFPQHWRSLLGTHYSHPASGAGEIADHFFFYQIYKFAVKPFGRDRQINRRCILHRLDYSNLVNVFTAKDWPMWTIKCGKLSLSALDIWRVFFFLQLQRISFWPTFSKF